MGRGENRYVATNVVAKCHLLPDAPVTDLSMVFAPSIDPLAGLVAVPPPPAGAAEEEEELELPLTEETKIFQGWRVSFRKDHPENESYESLRPKLAIKLYCMGHLASDESQRQKPLTVRRAAAANTYKKRNIYSKQVRAHDHAVKQALK